MARTLFFVGPSGSGKTTIAKELAFTGDSFQFVDVDLPVFVKAEDAEDRILCLEQESTDDVYLLAIGAYFQQKIPLRFWKTRNSRLVLVWTTEARALEEYNRRRQRDDNERFLRDEFYNLKRRQLYSLANYRCDTNLETKEESVEKCWSFAGLIFNGDIPAIM